MTLIDPRTLAAVDRGGGVRTRYLVTEALGAREFLTGITEFEPGASLALHRHNCEESVVVLEGTARFEHEGASHTLQTGAATWIQAGSPHRFANAGPGQLRILWIYGSVAMVRTLEPGGGVP